MRASRALTCLALLACIAARPAAGQEVAARRAAHVMRFTTTMIAIDALPVALRQPITLHLQDVTIERALAAVSAQTQLSLTYSRAIVPLDARVSVDVENGTVFDALRQTLVGKGVELWISAEGRLALVPEEARAERSATVAGGTITGRVTRAGSDGEAVPLATVNVGGTALVALTRQDGRYTLADVPAGRYWVHVRRLGYATDSVSVAVTDGQSTTADVALKTASVQLSTIVATGYGTQARSEVTGAIASVTAADMAATPVQTVNDALQGRATGVVVTQASGQPGAGAMVRIRGGNSVSAGNNPLYIIDGVPIVAAADGANTGSLMTQGQSGLNPLSALNPDDIESIDVLKDASTSAIYGARAANGVVLITTKRGRTGQSTTSFGMYYGTKEVTHELSLMDATQFATYTDLAYANAGQAAPFSAAQIATLGTGTNWQDAIFRKAPTQNYDLSFIGGSQDTKFYISGNLMKDDGIVIGTNMDRGSFRMNLDQTINSKVRIGTRLTGSHSQSNVMPNGGAGQTTSSVMLSAILAPPTLPIMNSDGTYFSGNNPLTGRPFANPVATASLITNSEQQTRGVGSVYADIDLASGLVFHSQVGGDFLTSTQDFYSPTTTLPGAGVGGTGSRGTLQTTNWLNENTLNYSHLYGSTNVDLLGGITLQHSSSQNLSGASQQFVTDGLGVNGLNSAATYVGVWTGSTESSLFSYFSRANLGWRDKYLLTVTSRMDGSSRFGAGNQYAFFPSAALAWRASEEDFVKNLGWFDDLKLRASIGRTGNQDIGNYASLSTLGSTAYVFGGQRAIGYVPGTLANPDLKWETTAQTDLGVDVAVLHNRLNVTADYYNKKTSDLLLYVPVQAISGFGSALENIGSVRNKGFELGVNTVNLTGRVGWTSTLNLAWNRNTILNLGADTKILSPGGVGAGANQDPTILQVGQPINAFSGYVFAGLVNGQATYQDLNGDGKITDADRTIIGSAQPNYTGGFNNRVTYGNFGLSMFLQFSVGNKIYNINRALLTASSGNGANQLVDVVNAGTGGIPVPKIGNTFDTRPSTLFLEDGSYLRGKNIRLDYNVPTAWLGGSAARLSSLQVYVSGQNFFTSTKYSGYDPEISEYSGSNLSQGIDFGTYPQAKQITFGFNTSF